MGPNVANPIVAGEMQNAVPLVNGDMIDGKVPKKIIADFTGGYDLL
jgi:hypothetical protein